MGYVATLPTSGPLLILPPALKQWGAPRRQGLRSHLAHKWATSDFAPPLQVHGGLFLRPRGVGRHRPGFDERDVHTAIAHHASCHSRAVGESFGVHVGSSLINCSRIKFPRSLIEDVQTRFKRTEWDGSATVEDWAKASSCSCERVFSYVTATDFGQSTERMCV